MKQRVWKGERKRWKGAFLKKRVRKGEWKCQKMFQRDIGTPDGGMIEMTEVRFYENAEDALLEFAVIISKTENQYVFCKHRDRETWEVPGGHREPGETIMETARRELYEETGALEFDIEPVCVYSVVRPDQADDRESFGMLFYADIKRFEAELHSEIEKIVITDELPERWTYPDIQPYLMKEAERRGYLSAGRR